MKCLTCHNSARGQNKPKRGQAWLDEVDPAIDRLSCGCLTSTSLLELVMTKTVAATHPNFPTRPVEKKSKSESTFPHSDFHFNPITIGMVEAFIFDLTRLNPVDLLCQPQVRGLRAVVGTMLQLETLYQDARNEAEDEGDERYQEELNLIGDVKKKLYRFSQKLASLQEENGLPGGSVVHCSEAA